jgi:hypothetical protein
LILLGFEPLSVSLGRRGLTLKRLRIAAAWKEFGVKNCLSWSY